ncbi:MAG: carbon storage regulator [Planctomycetota bacterium]|nr:carbon storage regulator [Planctomycetota bacterium]
MLVLTRTVGEELIIDGNIRVRVAEIKGGRIKLAIEAPRQVGVRRSEVTVPAMPDRQETLGAA